MSSILTIEKVVKRYQNHLAVDEVSFDMSKGTILGLLGPNGAGKTSLIRIITSITKADSGRILFDGEELTGYHPQQIGYLPEERGLYKKMKVGEQLLYLAQLKGLTKSDARANILSWMEIFQMDGWWDKKIEELSKGMQQKVQFVSTIAHRPKLIILDEPFTGLDPINTNLIKSQITRLNEEGTSVIFSTHRMEQVEEICEDIVLINNGKNILEGPVHDIKQTYKDNLFRFKYEGTLPEHLLENVSIRSQNGEYLTTQMPSVLEANQFMRTLMNAGVIITDFKEILPTLNDIFIKKVTAKA